MYDIKSRQKNFCYRRAGCGCRGQVACEAASVEHHATKLRLRKGYTLLELMIALGLLGALMSVAWSLMATFQIAEERGWKLTQRTQIIRAAHDWLQSDAQQVILQSPELSFTGSSLGFTTLIAPGLDPLPFLERLMSDSTDGDDFDATGTSSDSGLPLGSATLAGSTLSASGMMSDPELAELLNDNSPWNKARLEIQYELVPITSAELSIPAAPQTTIESPAEDEIQFMLVRREMLSGAAQGQSGSLTDDSPLIPASERVLTGQDLYRQSDEEQVTSSGIILSESRLEGLVRPQFQYSDGRSWKSSWSSRSAGGLPTAVALRFDFPPRAQMQPRPPRRSSDSLDAAADLGPIVSAETSAADLALAGESQVELETAPEASLMESEEYEVQMIVLFYRQPNLANRSQSSLGSTFGGPAFDYDSDFPLGNPAGAVPAEFMPFSEFSSPGGQPDQSNVGLSSSSPSSVRQTEQGNREQRDGF